MWTAILGAVSGLARAVGAYFGWKQQRDELDAGAAQQATKDQAAELDSAKARIGAQDTAAKQSDDAAKTEAQRWGAAP